ncbi:hypothetical protein [Streptomyces sp. NBC_01314]|uniref:hypothetical protein n=1 Tax=Streptomyces sp. NBC_01314 TaxID=2903821 RepID=UPI00309231FA|nr:hypothetical protein OG622_23690 [Streptomyces sp. NBC_01314]
MKGNRVVKRASALALTAIAIGGFTLATAGPASADHEDGIQEATEFGLYYNSGRGGCVLDLGAYDVTFSDNKYLDRPTYRNCPGEGQTVNDNSASYWNRASYNWYVWTDSYQEGTRGTLPAGYIGDATSTFKNEISSASYVIF